jgi:hypothetical protein
MKIMQAEEMYVFQILCVKSIMYTHAKILFCFYENEGQKYKEIYEKVEAKQSISF